MNSNTKNHLFLNDLIDRDLYFYRNQNNLVYPSLYWFNIFFIWRPTNLIIDTIKTNTDPPSNSKFTLKIAKFGFSDPPRRITEL